MSSLPLHCWLAEQSERASRRKGRTPASRMKAAKKQGEGEATTRSKGRVVWPWTAAAFCGSLVLLVGAVVFFVHTMNESQPKNGGDTVDVELQQQKWKNLRNSVVMEFSPIDAQLAVEIHNPSSAEWKALQWMAAKDQRFLSITSTTIPTMMIQRYAVVVVWVHFGLSLEPTLQECQWSGVECRDDIVVALDFTGKEVLEGSMPRSLAYLPSLEALDLSKHGLKGAVPYPCLNQWKKLRTLDLGENQLTSIFTGMETGSWSAMENLGAKNNALDETVPEALAALTNLRRLDLSGNEQLSGPLMEYAVPNWSMIESIVISRTAITGSIPDYVANGSLRNLTALLADFALLTGSLPESLSVASNLKELSLGSLEATWTGTLPSSYDKLTSLEYVALRDFKGITGSLPSSWGDWSNLLALDIWGTPLLGGSLPTEWGRMTSLTILRISKLL